MKKNILTILILAATLVNVTLSAVCVFVAMPAYKKTNNLITNLNKILELELHGETTAIPYDPNKVPAKNKEILTLEKGEMYVKLTSDAGETKAKYIQVELGIVLNIKEKDYKTLKDLVIANESLIRDMMREVISKYTASNIEENEANIKKELLERLQKEFDSVCIIEIVFPTFTPA